MIKDHLSIDGFRRDGRKCNELRHFKASVENTMANATGFCKVEMGCTKVVCIIHGPTENSKNPNSIGELDCKFIYAPFCGSTRVNRHWSDKYSASRGLELSQIFSSVILLEKLSRTITSIQIHVLNDDGGVMSAAINATTMALMNACIPISDIVASCTLGYIDVPSPYIDMTEKESFAAKAQLNLSMTKLHENLIGIDLDAKISAENFTSLIDAGKEACKEIAQIMYNLTYDRISKKAENFLMEFEDVSLSSDDSFLDFKEVDDFFV